MPNIIKPGMKVRFWTGVKTGRDGIVLQVFDKPKAIRVRSTGLKPEEWIVRPEDVMVPKHEQPF